MTDSKIAFRAAIFGLGSTLLLLAAKVILAISANKLDQLKEIDLFLIPVIFGASTSVAIYSYRILMRLSDTASLTAKISGDIAGIRKATEFESRESGLIAATESFSELPQIIAKRFINHVFSIISIQENKVGVNTTNLAVIFITFMWEELRKIQEKDGSNKIIVDIVHSDDITFWKRRDAERALERQRRFIMAGGEVNRIIQGEVSTSCLVRNADKKEPYADICLDIIDEMVDYGVNVMYIQAPKDASRMDFCVVRLKDGSRSEQIAMKWFINRSVLEYCDFYASDKKDAVAFEELNSEWNILKEKVEKSGRVWTGKNLNL